MIPDVARRLFKKLHEAILESVSEKRFGQLQCSAGELDHLNRFQPGDIVEKPSAAGVHQHGMVLQFQQLDRLDLFFRRQGLPAPFRKKGIHGIPVQDHPDVIVSDLPGIEAECRHFFFIRRSQ